MRFGDCTAWVPWDRPTACMGYRRKGDWSRKDATAVPAEWPGYGRGGNETPAGARPAGGWGWVRCRSRSDAWSLRAGAPATTWARASMSSWSTLLSPLKSDRRRCTTGCPRRPGEAGDVVLVDAAVAVHVGSQGEPWTISMRQASSSAGGVGADDDVVARARGGPGDDAGAVDGHARGEGDEGVGDGSCTRVGERGRGPTKRGQGVRGVGDIDDDRRDAVDREEPGFLEGPGGGGHADGDGEEPDGGVGPETTPVAGLMVMPAGEPAAS